MTEGATQTTYKRGLDFWMVYVSNLVVDMLSVLDVMAVSTALPTIVGHLNGTDFIWVGSAFTVASTAIIPFVGDLVSGFGRKPVLLAFILIFAIGSAICGAAQNMNMLIAGRAIAGFGGGGCLSITEIIYADMVPLPERGKFQGIIASVWALGCAIGPPIGGALANSGAWRWLFYLNLPLCGLAFLLTTIFLRVHTPKFEVVSTAKRMDWIGITVIVGSTVSLLIALTWGGLRFPWSSGHVLAPLIIGGIGLVVFFVYEKIWSGHTVPSYLFTSRVTLSGYIGTFCHGIVTLGAIYYLPVYFQAVRDASPIGSGVDIFPLTLTIPVAAIISGGTVKSMKRYCPQNYIGWVACVIGFGVLSMITENSSRAQYIATQIPAGVGIGMIWVATQFPILAPLPVSNSAHALGFHIFLRRFAQSFGIAIGGTILQNVLLHDLPPSFVQTLPQGVEIAYAIIPSIPTLDPVFKDQVRHAFARATQLIWRVLLGVSAVGLLSCLLMKEVELRTDMDEKWGLQEREKNKEPSLETGKELHVADTASETN
ncbi:iron permease [Polyporus arcularius HHB13444]|uniref:Iron permease n=1 Tax=Polyporus arcularius HHB13444 TaxID=1314778 RepID=A0A5C3PPU0_9APHY|nr:iron permease [Polyporus arcularius HHB13444]